MSFYNLEDLEVYQLAESFGDEIWFIVNEWDYLQKIQLESRWHDQQIQ